MELPGWGFLESQLVRLSREVCDYYYAAETAEDFQYRKGFLDGHNRTLNYIVVLIAAADRTEGEELQQSIAEMLDPFRRITLPREEEEGPVERISRVMERVKNL